MQRNAVSTSAGSVYQAMVSSLKFRSIRSMIADGSKRSGSVSAALLTVDLSRYPYGPLLKSSQVSMTVWPLRYVASARSPEVSITASDT